MRTVELMLLPSTRAATTATRFAIGSLFTMTIVRERTGNASIKYLRNACILRPAVVTLQASRAEACLHD